MSTDLGKILTQLEKVSSGNEAYINICTILKNAQKQPNSREWAEEFFKAWDKAEELFYDPFKKFDYSMPDGSPFTEEFGEKIVDYLCNLDGSMKYYALFCVAMCSYENNMTWKGSAQDGGPVVESKVTEFGKKAYQFLCDHVDEILKIQDKEVAEDIRIFLLNPEVNSSFINGYLWYRDPKERPSPVQEKIRATLDTLA